MFHSKKGQTWSMDLVLAVVLIGLVLVVFFSVTAVPKLGTDSNRLKRDSQLVSECIQIKDFLENGQVTEQTLKGLYKEDYEILKANCKVRSDFCIFVVKDNEIIPVNVTEGPGPQEFIYGFGSSDVLLYSNESEVHCGTTYIY